jgi:hypothetical protein
MRHLAYPVLALAAAMLLGTASVGVPAATPHAQGADPGVSGGSAEQAQDADTPSEPANATSKQEDRARHAAFDPLAQRLQYLHQRLHITPAQEPLWANLAQVIRENASSIAPLLKQRLQTAKSGNAIDSLGAYEKLVEAQLDGL